MSSGMNTEQAKEYAKTMTYGQAVSNCFHAKGIMYRKATLIKLHELAEIADILDKADTMYYPQVDGITPSVIVADTPQTDFVEDDKCFDCEDFFTCDEHQTDCGRK